MLANSTKEQINTITGSVGKGSTRQQYQQKPQEEDQGYRPQQQLRQDHPKRDSHQHFDRTVHRETVTSTSTGLTKRESSIVTRTIQGETVTSTSIGPAKRELSTATRTIQGETVTSIVSPTKRELGITQGEVKEQQTSKPNQERVKPSSIQD